MLTLTKAVTVGQFCALKLPQSGSILRAQYQTAYLCSKLNCASLPRPQGLAGPLNLGDIDLEQVCKLAGWGLTQNDIASFVGWRPQPSAVGPVPHQPGFLINLRP